jgi:tetratricopeptide (TPR) repeat protein
VNLQLGRLQSLAGLREPGIRSLEAALDSYNATALRSHGVAFIDDHIASARFQLSRAYENGGKLAEAFAQREQALAIVEKEFSQSPESIYLKEKLGSWQIAYARLLARTGNRQKALREGKLGLGYLVENAGRARAAALTMDLAAQRLLTVEPPELRDPIKARDYARRAVEQTGSQMPPYLVTLAFAELACGQEEDGRRDAALAVRGYRKISGILSPLFDSHKYPQAAHLYNDWQKQLSAFPELP